MSNINICAHEAYLALYPRSKKPVGVNWPDEGKSREQAQYEGNTIYENVISRLSISRLLWSDDKWRTGEDSNPRPLDS